MCMHLTNYAINKNNNFMFNKDEHDESTGHKWNLPFLWRHFDENGVKSEEVKSRIKDSIIKTFCSVQPSIAHLYHSCQGDDVENQMCFEILGFDIMIDSDANPWVIEVNHAPSFTTDTPLDFKIKK